MTTDLGTTNVLLGIMAAVSLLEAVAVIGVFVAGVLVVRRLIHVIDGIEHRQVAPVAGRVNAILDDVKDVTSRVKTDAERVDRAINRAGDIVDRWRARADGPPH